MLHTVMRSSIESASTAAPRYSITCPVAPSVLILPMMPRIRSFAPTPGAEFSIDANFKCLRPLLPQALRRQHVLDFAGADSECERAECAVRRGVAVAAYDRHARLREPELRPDHVDDSLLARAEIEQLDAELLQLRRSVSTWSFESRSVIGLLRSVVGTL